MAKFTKTFKSPGGHDIIIEVLPATGTTVVNGVTENTATVRTKIDMAEYQTYPGYRYSMIEEATFKIEADTVAFADGVIFTTQTDADFLTAGYIKS